MKQSKYATYGRLTHGMRHTRFYEIWKAMRRRCSNQSHEWYKNYGGKGVGVCKSWHIFSNFRDDMYSSYLQHAARHTERNTSIDRIDSAKGYSPKNCRWATRDEQANNTVRNIFVQHNGRRQTLAQWAHELDIKYSTLYRRYKRGKTGEALMHPGGGITRLQGYLTE